MRDPTGDWERRRREKRRLTLGFASLALAVVIFLIGAVILATNYRVFG
jgi:hypothetical protein